MEKQEFELLALSWWQNPWYWAFLLSVFIVLMALGLLLLWRWYRIRYRALTPEEQLLQDLVVLEKATFKDSQEQKTVCSKYMIACKNYVHTRFACAVDHLSDQEFVQALRTTGCSQDLIDGIAATLDMATQLKFAPESDEAKSFSTQITHIKQIIATLVKNQKNR